VAGCHDGSTDEAEPTAFDPDFAGDRLRPDLREDDLGDISRGDDPPEGVTGPA